MCVLDPVAGLRAAVLQLRNDLVVVDAQACTRKASAAGTQTPTLGHRVEFGDELTVEDTPPCLPGYPWPFGVMYWFGFCFLPLMP